MPYIETQKVAEIRKELKAALLRKKTFDPKELLILIKLGYKIVLEGHINPDLLRLTGGEK